MDIIEKQKELVSWAEGLDYTNTEEMLRYASVEVSKQSMELALVVMINALVKAPDFLSETDIEVAESFAWYEGSYTTYKYIKAKLDENIDNEYFYYKDAFESILEVMEEKYLKIGINLKERYNNNKKADK